MKAKVKNITMKKDKYVDDNGNIVESDSEWCIQNIGFVV